MAIDIQFIRKHFPHFKRIYLVDEPKKGVAWTQIKKRQLWLNIPKWNLVPFEHQFFILAHEEGHGVLHTKDEMEADKYAYDKYEKMNFNNTAAVQALQMFLDVRNPVHKARIWQQYQRSLKNDFEEFKIPSAFRKHYDTIKETKTKLKKILHG